MTDSPVATGTAASRRTRRTTGALQGNHRAVARAWERFASGETAVTNVRPEILASWQRCRDTYEVDPGLQSAPAASDHTDHRLDHDVLLTKLGGIAAVAGERLDREQALIAVTDGAGRVLASWGDPAVRARADDSNLAPWSVWDERTTGTNGMGTALEVTGPVTVTGPEHWCEGFHQWACAGVAIRDLVTGLPVAMLNVSRWSGEIPGQLINWLKDTAAGVESEIERRALREGEVIVREFAEVSSRRSGVFAALDLGGRVVVADDTAQAILGVPHGRPMVDVMTRWTPDIPDLPEVVRWATKRSAATQQWAGCARLVESTADAVVPVSFKPVCAGSRLVGFLCEFGSQDGDEYDEQPPTARAAPTPQRVVGVRNERIIVLAPSEIRYAEADRNTVWLSTDRGKVQAATRGLDNIERELTPFGFHRVHRRFLVNLRRVTELERGIKGELLLITDPRAPEFIPVSRRHTQEIRRVLGF
ncbi:transcriptional activator of acetoin/glycerol metabolism [Saccharomonospora marina XMU15]|uniref:Transcriptional activator of acetoin/glycerol metabolism n=1 Tax=Saccharomonospora marina XMU15 TaxID=882083 RepID=H5WYP6_9PSEU|nr:DNA-binding protein [Saccharomonospora marina]EHR50711.1 transcriptional activator of acetoin/glycerol metabolism [Saccharomonospora marina XMU15]